MAVIGLKYIIPQISGDCLCGSFARNDELAAVKYYYPDIAARFEALSDHIKEKFPKRCQWGWGSGPREKSVKESIICVECGDADPKE